MVSAYIYLIEVFKIRKIALFLVPLYSVYVIMRVVLEIMNTANDRRRNIHE